MGPLKGVRVVELAGIGPGPFTTMMLADMGAEVVRIDRADQVGAGGPLASVGGGDLLAREDVLARGRRSIGLDLRDPDGVETLLRLVEDADALVEGFRPGVMERLGVGPQVCLDRNARLVYGRMTGWGQEGPLAARAGHDIDYIAVAGALHPIGDPDEPPPVPLNYLGDFGGGGMLLAFGIACALLEARSSGVGQVVDAAMVDGAATLGAMFYGWLKVGMWTDERGVNLLDGSAPWYRCYRTADDRFVAVGAIEPQFYAALLAGLGLDPDQWPQHDRSRWPDQHAGFAEVFAERTRDEWAVLFADSDACVAPVMSLLEAADHPHMAARGTFVDFAGVRQPAPSPRFSRTAPELTLPPAPPGEHTDEILADAGFSEEEVAALRARGAVR